MIQVDDITKVPIEFLRTRDGRKITKIEFTDTIEPYCCDIHLDNSGNNYYDATIDGYYYFSKTETNYDILFDNITYEIHKIIEGDL